MIRMMIVRTAMHVPAIIEKKREGLELTDSEIRGIVRAYTSGELPDYQMSALAMAIFFRGMTAEETASLTQAMLESGEVLSYPDHAPNVVDKHSTGGIGDKVSLILAPLLACDELWVPMISGRGLGITGGTLDKLESIPGFRVDLSRGETLRQLDQIGVVMTGQTADICPADKKLYALRDVTGTVPSQSLIVASIMSKKLAESLDSVVLDVKFGSGAFMKTRAEAESLAVAMQQVGTAMGVETKVCLNSMDEPLGRAVGNALEVVEAIQALRGEGPMDLRDLVLDLSAEVSVANREQLAVWLDDGTAWAKFQQMVKLQGGDVDVLDRFEDIHPAQCVRDIKAERSGTVSKVDAEAIGRASLALGAGRTKADDVIDFSVGFDDIIKTGSKVQTGEVLARIHAANLEDTEAGRLAFLSGVEIV